VKRTEEQNLKCLNNKRSYPLTIMRKFVCAAKCLVFTMMCMSVAAQQRPHYTQYILNQYILNPAITGIENYIDVKISHRHQWVGIQDAPVTTYFTMHGPIGKKDFRTTATSFQVPGENPRGKRYWEEYTAAEQHHGAGVQIVNDKTGPINNFSANVTYAYHLGLSPDVNISAGVGAGINRISLNAGRLNFNVPVDPVVANSGVLNRYKPDLSAGIYLYSSRFFAGISAEQIIPENIRFAEDQITTVKGGKLVPHFFGTAGFRALLTDDINITPSVMVKYIAANNPQVEMNIKLQYHDLLWAGASYRHKDGIAAMVGLNVSNIFNVGYSYDYTTSRLNNFTKGTHEIVIGFLIGNRYGDTCPRNIW